ncbi:MAG: HU family DNA-binding protein [Acidimicrobiia bacterium]|nr:HU family DNA-binding protein [Acidimicrobiia bacterium]
MRKREFVLRLAEDASVSPAEAADQLDTVFHDVLKKIRQGKPARLPGLGTFLPGERPKFRFTDHAKTKSPKSNKR